jgi:ABC-type branched-subunit amino acid transport system ATPase component
MNEAAMLLEVNHLDVAYGDVQVLWDVSFAVEEGKIIAVVGANGAGKSTLLKTISGVKAPRGGEIRFRGERLDTLSPHDVVQRGIIQVPEGRKLFAEMTVEENLLMGAYHRRRDPEIAADLEHVYELFPRLKERLRQKAGSLSGGEQQMVAIGRGLMGRPALFLIDEMSLGLAPLIVDNLVEIVAAINQQGTTILLIEQDVQLALENSDYAYVLETGRLAKEGPSRELLGDPVIKEIYLGI